MAITKFEVVTLIPWPHSQICMGCKHGEFFQSATKESSDYICYKASTNNRGTDCTDMEEK